MQSKIKILVEKYDWKAFDRKHFYYLEYWLECISDITRKTSKKA